MLSKRYCNKDKQQRLLNEWQAMTPTVSMSDNPDKSKGSVFQDFVTRSMETQRQLEQKYQGDRPLKDRLSEAIDLPAVEELLRDLPAITVNSILQRVPGKLSTSASTAREVYTNWALSLDHQGDTSAYYGLGNRYGDETKSPPKNFKKGGRSMERARGRWPRPIWMRVIEGCFVYRRDHLANEHHSKNDVTRSINKLKAKHPAYMCDLY